MIKRTIKETVREYDEVGKLVRETITETMEDDDSMYTNSCYTYPTQTTAVSDECGTELTPVK